tara:strand:+ start:698 stop:877 length:180 start_codon:yes stop_codon:yes gene_type:complete
MHTSLDFYISTKLYPVFNAFKHALSVFFKKTLQTPPLKCKKQKKEPIVSYILMGELVCY